MLYIVCVAVFTKTVLRITKYGVVVCTCVILKLLSLSDAICVCIDMHKLVFRSSSESAQSVHFVFPGSLAFRC